MLQAWGGSSKWSVEVRRRASQCTAAQAQAFVLRWFLPVFFAIFIVLALWFPGPGTAASSLTIGNFRVVQTLNVMTVFAISGLTLRARDVRGAAAADGRLALAAGLVTILGVTPLAGFAALRLPFAVPEFGYGLAVFCAVPTTIAMGTALVTEADGNGALALLLTVLSNLLGVVAMPLWLKAYFASESMAIDAGSLLVSLLVTVLVPLVAGQAAQHLLKPVAAWVPKHKTLLKIISNSSLVLIMWQATSRSAGEFARVSGSALAEIAAASVLMHASFLALNMALATYVLDLERPEMVALVIVGSQKALPVALAVISFLPSLGSEGFMAIPPVVAQQVQLFMDAFLAGRWGAEARADDGGGTERVHLLSEDADDPEGGGVEEPGDTFLELPRTVQL